MFYPNSLYQDDCSCSYDDYVACKFKLFQEIKTLVNELSAEDHPSLNELNSEQKHNVTPVALTKRSNGQKASLKRRGHALKSASFNKASSINLQQELTHDLLEPSRFKQHLTKEHNHDVSHGSTNHTSTNSTFAKVNTKQVHTKSQDFSFKSPLSDSKSTNLHHQNLNKSLSVKAHALGFGHNTDSKASLLSQEPSLSKSRVTTKAVKPYLPDFDYAQNLFASENEQEVDPFYEHAYLDPEVLNQNSFTSYVQNHVLKCSENKESSLESLNKQEREKDLEFLATKAHRFYGYYPHKGYGYFSSAKNSEHQS